MTKISFIGTGKMATALMSCIYKNKDCLIIASNRTKSKLKKLKSGFKKIILAKSNIEAVKNSDIIFICVKPQDIDVVLNEIKSHVGKYQIIASIAAGITIKHIETKLKNKKTDSRLKIIRLMPNINCIVAEMSAGFSANKFANNNDILLFRKILSNAGELYRIKESQMDSLTALSGSGPAFFSYFISELANAAIKNGLDKDAALKLAIQTAYGTTRILKEKNIEPNKLISMVASPKGTTEAGLKVLEKSDFSKIIEKTINAAAKRSKALSK